MSELLCHTPDMSAETGALASGPEEDVIRMYRDGATLAQITEATGVARSSIYWVLRKHGITPDRLRSRSTSPPPPEGTTVGADVVEWIIAETQSLSARLDETRDCLDKGVRTLSDNQRRIDERLIQLRAAVDANTQAVLQLLGHRVASGGQE